MVEYVFDQNNYWVFKTQNGSFVEGNLIPVGYSSIFSFADCLPFPSSETSFTIPSQKGFAKGL